MCGHILTELTNGKPSLISVGKYTTLFIMTTYQTVKEFEFALVSQKIYCAVALNAILLFS